MDTFYKRACLCVCGCDFSWGKDFLQNLNISGAISQTYAVQRDYQNSEGYLFELVMKFAKLMGGH